MTPEQRDYVFSKTRNIVPNVDIAYRAAKNIEKFANLDKDRVEKPKNC